MTPEFVQQVAPALALPPRNNQAKGWVSPQAGLNAPENMYSADGTPLNWIQEAGGQRQFFVPEGQQAVTEDQLRGLSGSNAGLNDTRIPSGPPTELPPNQGLTLRGRLPFASDSTYTGRMPASPSGTRFGTMNSPLAAEPNDLLRGAPRAPTGTPPVARMRIPGAEGSPQTAPPAANDTLGSLLERFGFSIPQINLPRGGIPDLRGRDDPPMRGRYPEVGIPRGAPRNARPEALPSNANYDTLPLNAYPRFDEQGLAEFNQRMGLSLGPQVRSQAEQTRLQQIGATRATRSWHTEGYGADIRPQDIGGLTGQAAVNEVKRRLRAAGYPDNIEVIWESGHGRGQGTGAHVHIEPPGSLPQ